MQSSKKKEDFIMERKVIKCSKETIVKLTKVIATRDANTACMLLCYQPKMPDSVKKLKKI